jgi:sugar fermentation stimulation protein A
VRIEQPILEGRFLRRYKRFFADIELADGSVVSAHCPNTGSLRGCLEEGRRAILRDSQDPRRKLRYVFQAIQVGRTLVNVDTSLPNHVVHQAILAGRLPELSGYDEVRREVAYGKSSRIDLLLARKRSRKLCYVEVKSTTLAEGRTAMFPDAVTERGRKHLVELEGVVAQGHRAVQLYLVSRSDVGRFAPADAIDPAYGTALRAAARAGVRPDSIEIHRRLPVEL